MSKCLHDDELLADVHVAAEQFTDDVIAADKLLDVIGGSAGAILGLLRLYRDTQSGDVLRRATKCGEHLLGQPRIGPEGRRSWVGQGSGPRVLNGMAHGAAGFAYSLASLSAATGREEFVRAASECIAFENSSYDAEHNNWPDLRGVAEPAWPCQWCHGAPGIGLARIAMMKRGGLDSELLITDVQKALDGVHGVARCNCFFLEGGAMIPSRKVQSLQANTGFECTEVVPTSPSDRAVVHPVSSPIGCG
jgi:lantibiotic modifying enzyme